MNANNSIVLNFNNAAPVQSGLIFKKGDKGITFNLVIKGLDTTGMTAKIAFNRSNATSVEAALTGSGETWTYTTLGNEFAIPGVVVADVKFYNNDETQRVSTASFILGVIGDTLDGLGGGTAGYSDELEVLREEMEEAADTLEAYIEAYGDRGPLNPRGDYDPDEDYTVCDVVYHNNTSWINRVPCSGEEPTTSSAYWQKMIDAASGGAQELNDLDDVSVSSPTDGQAMIYDEANQVWKNQAIPTGSATLAGLTDVDLSSPTDGQAMIYDGIEQVWKNQAIPTGSATLAGLTDVDLSSPTNGQVLAFNSVTNEWENQTNTAAGFKPYIITTAATGATVTYSQGGTSITATEVSTGTFKADLTDYGTWTVTATLNGQTATTTVNVTSVGEYTAVATFFSATIAVTYPSGATCTCSATGQPTQTATGSPYTFTVGAAATYTLTCTLDGVVKTETVTITTEGQSETATFAYGTINLTIADEFRSTSITCTDGNVTITKTAPAAGNSMVFYPPTTGTWTISGTYSSQTYSTTATITALATAVSASLALTPDGSTVLPINDVPTWLSCCASTSGSTHTTLSEVLADSTELNALLQDQNACDYLVRCTSSTWTSTLCADENFMQGAGGQNYCSDLLIADSDWLEAIANSEYIGEILNLTNPNMSSNNTPSGYVASASADEVPSYSPFKAFDGNTGTMWNGYAHTASGSTVTGWLQMQFPNAVNIKVVKITVNATNQTFTSFNYQTSDDGSNYQTLATATAPIICLLNNNVSATYHKCSVTTTFAQEGYGPMVNELKFYGRQNV